MVYYSPTMPSLTALKGEKIVIQLLNTLLESKSNVMVVRLIEVEPAGLWLEGSDFADYAEARFKEPVTRTPIFFVPFSQIFWILDSLDEPYLSEKTFGL